MAPSIQALVTSFWERPMDGMVLGFFLLAAFLGAVTTGVAGFAMGLVVSGIWLHILTPVQTVTLMVSRSEEHTSELQSRPHLVCRLLLEKKKKNKDKMNIVDIRNKTVVKI